MKTLTRTLCQLAPLGWVLAACSPVAPSIDKRSFNPKAELPSAPSVSGSMHTSGPEESAPKPVTLLSKEEFDSLPDLVKQNALPLSEPEKKAVLFYWQVRLPLVKEPKQVFLIYRKTNKSLNEIPKDDFFATLSPAGDGVWILMIKSKSLSVAERDSVLDESVISQIYVSYSDVQTVAE